MHWLLSIALTLALERVRSFIGIEFDITTFVGVSIRCFSTKSWICSSKRCEGALDRCGVLALAHTHPCWSPLEFLMIDFEPNSCFDLGPNALDSLDSMPVSLSFQDRHQSHFQIALPREDPEYEYCSVKDLILPIFCRRQI